MKRKNVVCAVVSNAAIIILIGILFFVCSPVPSTVSVNAPYYNGDRESGSVALMFNVYERSDNVEKILSVLSSERITATFFVGGVWAEKNAPLLRKMSERVELGNHGYLHADHAKISARRNEEEIMLCHNLVEKLCGVKMNLFAPPSGSYGETCLSVCKNNSYRVVLWSKDTIDWRDKDVDSITKRAVSGIQSGDLILMHPTDKTVEALPGIIKSIKEKNLVLTTVSEVIGLSDDSAFALI